MVELYEKIQFRFLCPYVSNPDSESNILIGSNCKRLLNFPSLKEDVIQTIKKVYKIVLI